MNNLKHQVRKSLLNIKVQQNVVDAIPVIPIGYIQQPIIEADERGISWIDEFWSSAFKIMKESKKKKEEKVYQDDKHCPCPGDAGPDNQAEEKTEL